MEERRGKRREEEEQVTTLDRLEKERRGQRKRFRMEINQRCVMDMRKMVCSHDKVEREEG